MSTKKQVSNPFDNIDRMFYPFESDEPFKNCTICDCSLFDNETPYLIEKAIKGNDVIFEIAICMRCAQSMHSSLSKESISKIQAFMGDKLVANPKINLDQPISKNISDYIATCKITGKRIDPQKEFQIYAECVGNKMFWHNMPYALGPEAIEQMQELLSTQTREELDNFMGEVGIPPELREIFKSRPVLV